MTNYRFTAVSSNTKTGRIPVTTTSSETCPAACPLLDECYAAFGPIANIWRETDAGVHAGSLAELCDKVASLPENALWRHNQAGDLPGASDAIDAAALAQLSQANHGKRGFTYTHKPMLDSQPEYVRGNREAVAAANEAGFRVNLSANNLTHADSLVALDIGPVVTLLPQDVCGNLKLTTPAGHTVVVCPATYRDDVSCGGGKVSLGKGKGSIETKACGLCQRQRKTIVGFPAHGQGKAIASAVAQGDAAS